MQRYKLSALVSLVFSVFWAGMQWPWVSTATQPANNHLLGWLACVFFALVAVGLGYAKRWARILGLAAVILIVGLLLLELPVMYAFSPFLFQGGRFNLEFGLQYLGGLLFSILL